MVMRRVALTSPFKELNVSVSQLFLILGKGTVNPLPRSQPALTFCRWNGLEAHVTRLRRAHIAEPPQQVISFASGGCPEWSAGTRRAHCFHQPSTFHLSHPLRSFDSYLHKTFIPQEFDLPSPMRIPPDMIERISRLSQAFVEDVSEAPGKVCDTVEHLV